MFGEFQKLATIEYCLQCTLDLATAKQDVFEVM